jgi:hypothetical protein
MVKTAVFPPIPNARVSAAMAVKPRLPQESASVPQVVPPSSEHSAL